MNESTKSNLKKAIVIFFCAVALIGVAFGISYAVSEKLKPTNHNEQRYGVVKVRLAGWSSPSEAIRVRWAGEAMNELNRLGPTFVLADENPFVTVYRAEVVNNNLECHTKPAVFYRMEPNGQRVIHLDPVCLEGELEFKTAFMHELGHSIGMTHICRLEDNYTDCSTVGRGRAVMNPNLRYEDLDANRDVTNLDMNPLVTWELTDLDINEARRVLAPLR